MLSMERDAVLQLAQGVCMMKKALLFLVILLSAQAMTAQPWQADNTVFNPSGIPSLTFSQPRFADLDADGDYDFLLGNTNAAPLYVENSGSATTPDFFVGDGLVGNISSLDAEMGVCFDIDADGDLDLVTGGYTGLHLFLNGGTPTAAVFVEWAGFFSGLSVGSNPVPDLADVDNDSDPDLVVGLSEDGSVLLYTNTGSPTLAQFSQSAMQVLGDVGLYAYPVFCDLDADNDQDILVGRDSHGFIYYQNVGTPSVPDWQPNNALFAGLGMIDYWNSPDLVDLNNDDLYDLVFGTASGPLQYYVNTGTPTAPVWQANTSLFGGVLDVGGASSPVFFDFDADGDLDMISGSQLGNIKYFRNTGTVHAPAWVEDSGYFASIDHSIYAAVAIGDVNADGLPDAIIGDLSGHLYYHRNTGMGFVQETNVLASVALGGWTVPRLLDMDNDGDLDLAAGCEAGTLRFYNNQGSHTVPDWVESVGYFGTIDVGSDCSPCFGDVDYDGDIDFVAGNISGNLQCYLRQGFNWAQNTALFSGITTDQNAAPALVDLDSDGDLDLVVGDYDGTFSYHRNLLYSGTTLNPPLNLEVAITTGVILTWDAPATGSTSPFQSYELNVNGVTLGTTDEHWDLGILPPGTSYTASVTAIYVAGVSTPASISWVMPQLSPPTDLIATVTGNDATLSWLAPDMSSMPRERSLTGYNIYHAEVLIYSVTDPGITTYTVMDLPNGSYTYAVSATYSNGESSQVSVDFIINYVSNDDHVTPVLATELSAIQPNPFHASTGINYSVKTSEPVRIDVFNSRGQLVRTLVNEVKSSGSHSIVWDGHDMSGKAVSSGVYYCRMSCGAYTSSRRMVLLK